MKLKIISLILISLLLFVPVPFSYAQSQNTGTVSTVSEGERNRFAPGEFLSFSIKLINFGSQRRIDVTTNYQILDDKNNEVYFSSETVAVDTTASFVKRVPLPVTFKSGNYILVTSLIYPGQEQPAVSRFDFVVEEKIGGFFKSDLLFYVPLIIVLFLVVVLVVFFLTRKIRSRQITVFDYSHKPKNQIVYYEMLSDIINHMRLRIGDSAIEIAQNIPDLEIDYKTGKVINIKKEPAKIIALLVYRFEKMGHKVSFGLRQD